jgi:hypothetical protein
MWILVVVYCLENDKKNVQDKQTFFKYFQPVVGWIYGYQTGRYRSLIFTVFRVLCTIDIN